MIVLKKITAPRGSFVEPPINSTKLSKDLFLSFFFVCNTFRFHNYIKILLHIMWLLKILFKNLVLG